MTTPSPLAALGLLVASIALVVLFTMRLRLHAFLALVLAALATGWGIVLCTPSGERARAWAWPLEHLSRSLGETAGKVALLLAFASVIAACLEESGAAERLVEASLRLLPSRSAALALLAATYFVSIPIFVDSLYMLLLPLARALSRRPGQNLLSSTMAVGIAGMVTHCLVAPHPGPAAMADALGLELSMTMFRGLAFGMAPALLSWWIVVRWRAGEFASASGSVENEAPRERDFPAPSLTLSLLPIALPLLLMALGPFAAMAKANSPTARALLSIVVLLGNRYLALLVGVAAACWLLLRSRGRGALATLVGSALERAGLVILITSAGGALGEMLNATGFGAWLGTLLAGRGSLALVVSSWACAALFRLAQGSATVAMLSTSSLVAPLLEQTQVDRFALFSAIAFGSMIWPWMNDSAFWVFRAFSRFDERQCLRSLSVALSLASVLGLLESLWFASF